MDMKYLGLVSFNYAGIALISGFILQYVGALYFSSALQASMSSLVQITGFVSIATLMLFSLVGLIGTSAFYLYRKNYKRQEIKSYDSRVEILGVFLPILLTPLGGLVVGVLLYIIGKIFQ
jgi:hypothetical protein